MNNKAEFVVDVTKGSEYDFSENSLKNSDNDIQNEDGFIKSKEETMLVRKLNWTLLPIVFLIIFIQFCDKSALSVAAVLGIQEDTNMSGSQYSWLCSIFYLGYLICQFPNSYLVQSLPIARYFGVVLIIWGIIMISTAACNTVTQLMGLRFLLGLFEGVTYPCIYITLNSLYRRSEQSRCWGFIGVGTGMGTVFGVSIAYGLTHLDGVRGLRAWRWGYIVFGAATIGIGIVTFFFLVDKPYHRLLRLTRKEKEIVKERLQDNCAVRVKKIKKDQIWEALSEPRLYLLFLANLFNCLQNGGLVTFSTLIVEGLGFSSTTSVLLQIPNGVAAASFSLGGVLLAKKIGNNSMTAIFLAVVSLIGIIIMAAVPGTPKLAGFYLSWAMTGQSALVQTLITNNVSGYTKRVFYNGAGMIAMTIGNFCGPIMMVENQAPTYIGAMIGYAISNVLFSVCVGWSYYLMRKENKRRLTDPLVTPTDVYLDLTDVQDRNIIYKL